MASKKIVMGRIAKLGKDRRHIEIPKEDRKVFEIGERVFIVEEKLVTTSVKNDNEELV